jgi:hypothetical protein
LPNETSDTIIVLRGKLAGAEGFEPSPSTLTVWCPTGWTTPQRRSPAPTASGFPESGWAPLQKGAAEGSSKIPCPRISQGSPSTKIYLSIQSSGASRDTKGGPAKGQRAKRDEVTGNLIRRAARAYFGDNKARNVKQHNGRLFERFAKTNRFAETNFVEASISAEKLHSGMFYRKLSRSRRPGFVLLG